MKSHSVEPLQQKRPSTARTEQIRASRNIAYRLSLMKEASVDRHTKESLHTSFWTCSALGWASATLFTSARENSGAGTAAVAGDLDLEAWQSGQSADSLCMRDFYAACTR